MPPCANADRASRPSHPPLPARANHHNIVRDAHVEGVTYPYYRPETRGLDFEGMMDTFSKAPAGSVVLLHACAHNPTGALEAGESPACSLQCVLSRARRLRGSRSAVRASQLTLVHPGCRPLQAWTPAWASGRSSAS